MSLIPVRIEYRPGVKQLDVSNVQLMGSWNAQGQFSKQWTCLPMIPFAAEDGCHSFFANVCLAEQDIGREFRWGVTFDQGDQKNIWGITTEIKDIASNDRYCSFILKASGQTESYYLTHCYRLGANKHKNNGTTAVRFALWAPNAKEVALVWGDARSGYIGDSGQGIVGQPIPLCSEGGGIWSVVIPEFKKYDHVPYMYKIIRKDETTTYRTDMYSRCQIGSGGKNPARPDQGHWNGTPQDLNGTPSCSVVVDPDCVAACFEEKESLGKPVFIPTQWIDEKEFWKEEFSENHPLPKRIEDLVIYELHIDGLGAGKTPRGTFCEAMELLDYLVDLGINCIELMPTSEYSGAADWGYKTSHFMAIEYAAGGRDQLKHFVRACHQRGIAVIMDVVYNHYAHDAERAEWAYDSAVPEENCYYWYEGRAEDYPEFPDGSGGYIDNMSTGYAPRFHEEMVRKLFISSAAMLMREFHIDGFRADQTSSLHAYAVLHADGRPATNARIFGARFLREWTRTLRMLKPGVFLIAEDHSGWEAVTESAAENGLGFDATWYAEYYHQLVGDSTNDSCRARLLKLAGIGDNRALCMDWFLGTLGSSSTKKVIYHESHDEAGNSSYRDQEHDVASARTIQVAVNGAPLVDATRLYAEARVRFTAGLTFLARGIPMFFMGEEVGAAEPYRYSDFIDHREDFFELKKTSGARLFVFYKELVALHLSSAALRSKNFFPIHAHNENRVLTFWRWEKDENLLIIASLNNQAFSNGYSLQCDRLPTGVWKEKFNSDDPKFGGQGILNPQPIISQHGLLSARIPANGIVVLQLELGL